jgi:multiple antibiotic resistance protein
MQEIFILYITSLFTMINPLGAVPLYVNLTKGFSETEKKKIILKSCLAAFIMLCLLSFSGKLVFDFFSISISGLKVVGGFLFFTMGHDMLSGRTVPKKLQNESNESFGSEIAITPLAIPMICGPGSITMVLIFMQDASGFTSKSILIISIAIVMVLTGIILNLGNRILDFFGDTGSKVMMRLMGLIVMLISVEFFFSGITPYVRAIFKI